MFDKKLGCPEIFLLKGNVKTWTGVVKFLPHLNLFFPNDTRLVNLRHRSYFHKLILEGNFSFFVF